MAKNWIKATSTLQKSCHPYQVAVTLMKLPSGESGKFDINLSNLKATSGYVKGNFSHFQGSSRAFCQRPSSTTQPQGLQWSLSVPEKEMYILSWALNDHSLGWNVISFYNSFKGGWKKEKEPNAATLESFYCNRPYHAFCCTIQRTFNLSWLAHSLQGFAADNGSFHFDHGKNSVKPTARHCFYSGHFWQILKSQWLHDMREKTGVTVGESSYISYKFCLPRIPPALKCV